MDARKLILVLHRWIGLVAALTLLVLGLSAALLVFERPVHRLLNSSLVKVAPLCPRLPLKEIARRLEVAYPQYHVAGWELPQRPDEAISVALELNKGAKPAAPSDGDGDDDENEGLELAVNPYTGEILGDLGRANDLMVYVHRFHTHFLSGDVGSAIVGWSAVCLLVLNLTGLILWWRRKIGRFRWSSTGALFHFQVHQAIGIYAWIFLMVLSVTGIALHWEGAAGRLADRLTGSPPRAEMLPADPVQEGAVPLDSDQLVSIAETSAPGARVTVMQMATKPQQPVRMIMKYPEDHTPAGRTQVFVDGYSGKVRMLADARSAPLGFKLMRLWNRQYHTGDIFGWPTQMLALIFSLALVAMAITGPMIWYKRKRTPQTAQAAAAND
ncbi:MAG TPA: PepSY-associated TM helix domain-containing protein [Candidatus Angelobacter sp.]|nr:PepSY-associated TM helix domain-containing protein [Candidatus Angelobacter sp.]